MIRPLFGQVFLATLVFIANAAGSEISSRDPRNITNGLEIPNEGYCDQPYIVTSVTGAWVCVMTTGPGKEGQLGQHVVSTRSTDRGRTWSKLVDIEPTNGPESSWAVPLITPSGRIYAFYDYNGDGVREKDGKAIRADMLGWYVYRFSDDEGKTWSAKQYRLPVRVTACDRSNDWQGKVQIFWGICEPVSNGKEVAFSFTKLGRYMLDQGEGWLFQSPNILTEADPERLLWNMWPEGDHGIRHPDFGSVQEEFNVVWTGPDQLYAVYRTTLGHPCQSTSTDGGRTWSTPVPLTYTPGGKQIIRTPRACPRIWRTSGGKFLLWFHNHAGKSFQDRNPAWISGGVLKEGKIHWSQPEILLYDDNSATRMSYPDLVEEDGEYYFSETNKEHARIHRADRTLINSLWTEQTNKEIEQHELLYDRERDSHPSPPTSLASSVDLEQNSGVTLEAWIDLERDPSPGMLIDTRSGNHSGMTLEWTAERTIRWTLSDGKSFASWESNPVATEAEGKHHVVAIADTGPRIMMFVVDGQLNDGAGKRTFGWGRWKDPIHQVAVENVVASNIPGVKVEQVRLYRMPLRVSQAIAHFHAGP